MQRLWRENLASGGFDQFAHVFFADSEASTCNARNDLELGWGVYGHATTAN
jgi:hypothetical protein